MTAESKQPDALILVWEFRVHPEQYFAFERAYGSSGDWVQLFRRGKGYVGTELYRDAKSPGRYFTLDHWESRLAFEAFKNSMADDYAALDSKCEVLTEDEVSLGQCETREQALRLLPESAEIVEPFPRVCIRPATAADISSMLSLEESAPYAAHWHATTYEQMFHSVAAARIVLVAENDTGALCGFCIARIGADECELENVVVTEAQRRTRIGNMLLHTLIALVREKNARHLLLEVRESNRAARGLYESCGFELSGRRRNYYSAPPEDALIYTLPL